MERCLPRIAKLEKPWNLAGLIAWLGDVSFFRIRLLPAPGFATGAEIENVRDVDDDLCELVVGVQMEKPVGLEASLIALELAALLKSWVLQLKLDYVTGPDGEYA